MKYYPRGIEDRAYSADSLRTESFWIRRLSLCCVSASSPAQTQIPSSILRALGRSRSPATGTGLDGSKGGILGTTAVHRMLFIGLMAILAGGGRGGARVERRPCAILHKNPCEGRSFWRRGQFLHALDDFLRLGCDICHQILQKLAFERIGA